MKSNFLWVKVCATATVFAAALGFALCGCTPSQNASSGASTSSPDAAMNSAAATSQDTVSIGEYDAYDPSAEAENTSGTSIEGSEEEQLQQERIAGGAVGGVVSKNLEPLEGITDYSEGDYVPTYGANAEPPVIGHGDNGSECLGCHDGGEGASMPASHIGQQLTNDECVVCHQPAA